MIEQIGGTGAASRTTPAKSGERTAPAIAKWPDPCACGHGGHAHHGRFSVTGGVAGFGPEQFCTGNDHTCPCESYRAAEKAGAPL